MFAAVALAAYLVQPGDTLSGIAASHSVSLAAVEAANPQISNFNLIFAGQTVELPSGATAVISGSQAAPVHQSVPVQQSAPSYTSPSSTASATATVHHSSSTGSTGSSGYSSSSLSDIPGVPSSLASCVAYRESTNLQNPAADGNAYGIIPASGYNV